MYSWGDGKQGVPYFEALISSCWNLVLYVRVPLLSETLEIEEGVLF